jgi:hypothetical protein
MYESNLIPTLDDEFAARQKQRELNETVRDAGRGYWRCWLGLHAFEIEISFGVEGDNVLLTAGHVCRRCGRTTKSRTIRRHVTVIKAIIGGNFRIRKI